MDPYPMPGDDVQAFNPQPVPSFNYNKQRGQKHPRRGKNGPNRFSGHSDAHHNKHGQPQSCFNCGSLQHLAQQCPEPRREFPAGATKPGRPPKRQKTTGSTSTNFAHEPNYTRGPNPPQRGYTHPPIAHAGYQQISMAGPGPYGPPTPMSAGPHGPSPWPHEHSPVQYNQPFGPHGLPTPMSAYGSQFPCPSTTQASVPPQNPYFPPQYSPQYGEPEYHHRQNSFDHHHQAPSHGGNNRQPRKKWRHSEHVPSIAPPIEPWMEELQSLDIPDSGPSPSEIVWRPANQVSRALSSILDERDEIGMLPPFVPLPPNMSVSKYILDKGPEEFVSNIKHTEDWPFMMADPIFLEIVTECQLIPVVELIARRKEIFETHRIEPPTPAEEVGDVEDDENPGEEAPEREGSVIGSDDHDQMSERRSSQYSPAPSGGSADHYRDDISHPGSADDDNRYSYRQSASPEPMEYPVSPSTKTDYNDHDYHDHQNSNNPHSKRSGNHYSGPNWRKQPNGRDQDRDHMPQGDGPAHRPNSQGQRGNKRGGFDRRGGRGSHFATNNNRTNAKPKQQYNGPPKSKSKKGPNQRGNPSNRGNWGSQNHPNRSNQFGMDGAAEPNLNNNNFQDHQHSQGQPDFQQLSPHESHQSHGQDDAARNNRKRSRRDDSPDRSDDGPRRQEDDITPKIKRRQPHVAEAYSRRW